jgi:hypothetical protein
MLWYVLVYVANKELVSSEFLDWLILNLQLQRADAIAFATKMHQAGIFVHVVDRTLPFRPGYYFYRFNSVES